MAGRIAGQNRDAPVAALAGAAVSLGLTFEYLFLTCFGCPPRLVFLLALVAWPIGGALHHGRRAACERPFARALAWLVAASAAAWILPQLHAGLPPEGEPHAFWPLWVTILPLVAPLPFFVAHGFVELSLYERAAKRDSAQRIYAWILAGHALGLAVGIALQRSVGPTSVLGAAFACAWLARAAAGGPEAAGKRRWLTAAMVAVVAIGLTALTGPAWLHRALAIHWQSQGLERDGYREVFTRWGRYGLVSLREKGGTPGGLGLLNDIVHWSYGDPAFDGTSTVDALPFLVAEPSLPAVVIGAGGGRQVAMAIAAGARDVRAIELEPAVIDYFRRIRPAANRNVFVNGVVAPMAAEGRAAVERLERGLGLVYVADAGAARYNSLDLLIDGSFLLTREALREYAAKLAPGGVIASFTHHDVDPDRRMLAHVVATFRDAGLVPWSVSAPDGYVVLGAGALTAAVLQPRMEASLARIAGAWTVEAREPSAKSSELLVGMDDRPLSQLLYAMSVEELRARLQHVFGGVCAIAAVFVFACSRFRWLVRAPRAWPWGCVSLAGVAVGLNFALLEVYAVGLANRAFHEIFLSTIAASLGFLLLAGCGGLVEGERARRRVGVIGILGASATFACAGLGDAVLAVVGCAVMTLATGTLFPSLVRADARHLVVLFIADALGATIAAVVGLLGVPLWGVRATGSLTAVVFLAALGTCAIFARRTSGLIEAPVDRPADQRALTAIAPA